MTTKHQIELVIKEPMCFANLSLLGLTQQNVSDHIL